jgi:hypothetical protein
MAMHWRIAGSCCSLQNAILKKSSLHDTKNQRRGTGETYATAPCAIGEAVKTVKGISVTVTNR